MPAQWTTEGGVFWTPGDSCNSYGFNFQWQAENGDGAYGVGLLPTVRWTSVSDGVRNCPNIDLRSAQAYLEWLVRTVLPNAQMLDYRPRPDIAAEAGLQSQRTPMPGGELASIADAGELLIAYAENGRTCARRCPGR